MKILSPSQRDVETAVRQLGSVTIREVAAHLDIPVSTAQGRMMTLIRYGCVKNVGTAVSGGMTFEVAP